MESTRTEVPVAFGLTDPIVRVDSGYKRMYEVPVGDNIFSAPSVTSITDATLRSIGVEKWKESLITKKLYSMTGNVLRPDDVNEVMSAPDREFKGSGELGTQLHEIIHGLINETDVRIPDQLLPAVKGCMKWRESYIKDWTLAGSEAGVHPTWGRTEPPLVMQEPWMPSGKTVAGYWYVTGKRQAVSILHT